MTPDVPTDARKRLAEQEAQEGLTAEQRERLRVLLAKWSKSEQRVEAMLQRDIAPTVATLIAEAVAEALRAAAESMPACTEPGAFCPCDAVVRIVRLPRYRAEGDA